MSEPLPLYPGAKRCVNCGYCCQTAPCPYGEWDAKAKRCKQLTPDNLCAKCAEIMKDKENWHMSPAFGAGCCSPGNSLRRAKATTAVNKMLEAEDDLIDPKDYIVSLRRKREVVQELIKRYAVRHRWDYGNGERVAVTFPKELDFVKLLRDHGVPCHDVMGISGGSNNYRLQFYWAPGDLDTLVSPPHPTPSDTSPRRP